MWGSIKAMHSVVIFNAVMMTLADALKADQHLDTPSKTQSHRSMNVLQYDPKLQLNGENMESVAEEVRKRIVQGSFGGHPLQCYRGVKQPEYVFNDEEKLRSMNKEGKLDFSSST